MYQLRYLDHKTAKGLIGHRVGVFNCHLLFLFIHSIPRFHVPFWLSHILVYVFYPI